MSALKRFWSAGARDADRRLAAVIAPQPFEPADRYLRRSTIVAAVDRATVALERWWQASRTGQSSVWFADRVRRTPRRERWQAIAIVLVVAVAVHVTLMMIQGPRPGWFWLIVPAMAALFGLLVIAGARSQQQS
jgi:hypothetical protein